jgi:hypothetical protein
LKSKSEYELFNNNLTKVSAEKDINEIMETIIEKKFEYSTREWFLATNVDTVNVYTESKDIPFRAPSTVVNI